MAPLFTWFTLVDLVLLSACLILGHLVGSGRGAGTPTRAPSPETQSESSADVRWPDGRRGLLPSHAPSTSPNWLAAATMAALRPPRANRPPTPPAPPALPAPPDGEDAGAIASVPRVDEHLHALFDTEWVPAHGPGSARTAQEHEEEERAYRSQLAHLRRVGSSVSPGMFEPQLRNAMRRFRAAAEAHHSAIAAARTSASPAPRHSVPAMASAVGAEAGPSSSRRHGVSHSRSSPSSSSPSPSSSESDGSVGHDPRSGHCPPNACRRAGERALRSLHRLQDRVVSEVGHPYPLQRAQTAQRHLVESLALQERAWHEVPSAARRAALLERLGVAQELAAQGVAFHRANVEASRRHWEDERLLPEPEEGARRQDSRRRRQLLGVLRECRDCLRKLGPGRQGPTSSSSEGSGGAGGVGGGRGAQGPVGGALSSAGKRRRLDGESHSPPQSPSRRPGPR